MPSQFKIVLFRSQPPKNVSFPSGNWTSTYYAKATDFPTAINNANALNTAELGLMPNDVRAGTMKIFDRLVPRSVQHIVPTQAIGTWVPTPPSTSGDSNLAAFFIFRSGTTKFSNKYMRGMPSEFFIMGENIVFNPTSAWGSPKQLWQTAVLDNAVLTSQKKQADGTYPVFAIDDIIGGYVSNDNLASIRRSGRPFVLRRGRRLVG